ncbi:hypothetical protein [Williamsia deligens]|uniref:DUF559 domain-containing protein n=1 Tax=Williamsia deligens TaxID=321325 RepID=A0ABW3G2G1_9NOCA|nr:hypothetical protein [Williamsia deligens]MCP2194434.1 Very-short-patch-repair endonuclease [Williamsia deligens]
MRDTGVLTWDELRARGETQASVRQALADETLLRLRRGWYARSDADSRVVDAVTRGGVLSCVSALRFRGIWVPGCSDDVHARANASRDRTGRFCSQHGRPESVTGPVDEIPIALRHAARCLDAEGLVVVCDSILNGGHFTLDDLAAILRDTPVSVRALLDRCDGEAQSGTESMVRLRLRARNIPVRTQVTIPGVGRVDLVVGERLIIETDGERYHSGIERYTEDRRRDREAARLGYITLRLTYADVVDLWGPTEQLILEMVRQRRHRRPRHNRHG